MTTGTRSTNAGAVRTLPEQIADDLGGAIARGEFRGGERLTEQELAAKYEVSRGPVREAIRILAHRGLATLYPRRGAYVVEPSLDTIVDLFNTRAVLMGLAARYFAAMADDEARQQLQSAVDQLRKAGELSRTTPAEFIQATSRVGRTLARNCGSESLWRIIDEQNRNSLWGTIWQSGPVDFDSSERRAVASAEYQKLGEALNERKGDAAEAIMRRMIMVSREKVLASISSLRGVSFDERRLLIA